MCFWCSRMHLYLIVREGSKTSWPLCFVLDPLMEHTTLHGRVGYQAPCSRCTFSSFLALEDVSLAVLAMD